MPHVPSSYLNTTAASRVLGVRQCRSHVRRLASQDCPGQHQVPADHCRVSPDVRRPPWSSSQSFRETQQLHSLDPSTKWCSKSFVFSSTLYFSAISWSVTSSPILTIDESFKPNKYWIRGLVGIFPDCECPETLLVPVRYTLYKFGWAVYLRGKMIKVSLLHHEVYMTRVTRNSV